jgi:hypothetical protein
MAPSGETRIGSTQENMAVNDHAPPPDPPSHGSCPDENEIAALLNRTLPAWRRAAIEVHVASCETCSENYDSALRLEVDEEQRMSLQAPQQRPFEGAAEMDEPLRVTPQAPQQRPLEETVATVDADRTATVAGGLTRGHRVPDGQRPHFDVDFAEERADRWAIRSRAWRRGAVTAVAAMLVASLGLLLVRGTGDLSTEGLSADLLKSPAAIEKVPWQGRTMRGGPGGGKEMQQNLADFRLGVGLLDLRLALAGTKIDPADTALRRIRTVLGAMNFVPRENLDAYQRIRNELNGGTPPAALLPEAAAEEKKLASAGLKGQFVDLGRWTEACRLGAAARQQEVFHSRAARRLLDQGPALGEGLSGSGDGPNQRAAEILRDIKAAAGAERIDFDTLGKRCTDLLDQLDSYD